MNSYNEYNHASIIVRTNLTIRGNNQVFKKNEENNNKSTTQEKTKLSFIEIAHYQINYII